MGEPIFSVRSDLFRAVAVACSDEETRTYLHGVYIQPHPVEGVLMVATDGHRLLVAHDAGGSCSEPVIVKLSGPVLKAAKAKKTDHIDGRRLVADDENGVRVVIPHESAEVYPVAWKIEGTFPDWRRVIPDAKRLTAPCPAVLEYNAEYLGDFAKAAAEIGNSRRIGIRTYDANGPALVTFEDDRLFGILMPMRVSPARTLYPYFMSPRYKKTEAAA